MRETSELPTASLRAPNPHPSSYPQSPRTPRDDAKFAVGKIRQNSTQSDRIPHDATKTRARAHARVGGNGVPFLALGMDCAQAAADSTRPLELPSHSRHANKSNEPRRTIASLALMNRIHWNACGPLPAAVASASEVPQCPSQT